MAIREPIKIRKRIDDPIFTANTESAWAKMGQR